MDTLTKSEFSTIAQLEIKLERILELVPIEHRGLLFERVLKDFHPQENTSMLELGFAIQWALCNTGANNQLFLNLAADHDDPRAYAVPKTKREWEVATLVAASIIRWLATSGGCCFLEAAFKRGGGSMTYTLPDPKNGMPALPEPPYIPEDSPNYDNPPIPGNYGDSDEDEDDWPMT